jgi:hypothetical protein
VRYARNRGTLTSRSLVSDSKPKCIIAPVKGWGFPVGEDTRPPDSRGRDG